MSDKIANILVVDDSEISRKEIVSPLLSHGFKVIEASNGQEGLEAIETGEVDLVIADVYMPGMTGVEMCEIMKNNPAFPQPPVLIVTTESSPDVKSRAKEIGIRGWVIKPVDAEQVINVIRRILSKEST